MKKPDPKKGQKKPAMKKMAVSSNPKENISIRSIANGYIVRRSCETKDGYEESEYYTDKKPEIEMPKGK
jgi:hypothetical protein